MRRFTLHLRPVATLLGALLLLALLPLGITPPAAEAQVATGGSFGSAVPCLLAEDTFATTCFADTIFNPVPGSDPALVQLSANSKGALAPLGSRSGGFNAPVNGGIGAVYGLAYDDGSTSGQRRLFAAAYAKRLISFGQGGAGGIYAYNFTVGSWSSTPVATVGGAEGALSRGAGDRTDQAAVAQVGKSSLGDMEISPDGRTLYVMNLGARRIERFTINTDGSLSVQSALGIPFGLANGDPAAQADMRPFALEFFPVLSASGHGLLTVGITDSAQRGVAGGRTTPSVWPSAYVLSYDTGTQAWTLSLAQSLVAPGIGDRHEGSEYPSLWQQPAYRSWDLRGWNPWRDSLNVMPARPSTDGRSQTVYYPQPLLSDIEFVSPPGSATPLMLLGFRDRTGDQVFANNPPGGNPEDDKVAITQGDTLAYSLAGGWNLQRVSRSDPANSSEAGTAVRAATTDYLNDNTHAYRVGANPAHIENLQGGLASAPQGGPDSFAARVASTTLLGNSASGIAFYGDGGQRTSVLQLISGADRAGGKATALGDMELLCTYAIVGGRVWQDINPNGAQDGGEPAFSGITLEAFHGSDPSAPALARATTGADGRYRFALPPNVPVNIRVARADFQSGGRAAGWRFALTNQGSNDGLDSDAAQSYGYIEFAGTVLSPVPGVTGAAVPMAQRNTDRRDYDIGLTNALPTGQLGDRVWNDANGNGVQDGGEGGVANVWVTLKPQTALSAAPLSPERSLTTSASGAYLFTDLYPGSYKVEFGLPAGYTATLRDQGDDGRDSDADASTGYQSAAMQLIEQPPSANDIRTIDFGVRGGTDVAISKTGARYAFLSQNFSYQLTVQNLSASIPAENVQVYDTVPVQFLSASPAPSARNGVGGRALRWDFGRLQPGEQRTITINVVAPSFMTPTGAISMGLDNTASVAANSDTNASNNSAAWHTDVVRPEVSIVKSAPAQVLAGDDLLYELRYTNTGAYEAANATLTDILASDMVFVRFVSNPDGACSHNSSNRRITCVHNPLPVGATKLASFVVQVKPSRYVLPQMTNTGRISTTTPGDDTSNNQSDTTTTVLYANPGVSISIVPHPFPVGESGTISVPYRNYGTGESRNTVVTVQLPSGSYTLGTLPAGCGYNDGTRIATCAVGPLVAGARGTLDFPITLPPDFPLDQLAASATISTSSWEHSTYLANNTASTTAPVIRPNVFVTASGPNAAARLGQGSFFRYAVGYGNIYRRNPGLTRAAANTILKVTLPDDVTFVQASTTPSNVNGQILSWNLGTLNSQQLGSLFVEVRTNVPAGTLLTMVAEISTTTPGDDPLDNRATVDTVIVPPPADIPDAQSDLRLAIHSDLDPNSQDSNPTNGVYLSQGAQISWPAGEVLDFTPRLNELEIDDPGFPYEHRGRIVGWSIVGYQVNGRSIDPAAADSRGISGCRTGASVSDAGSTLVGCRYGYIGARSSGVKPADLLPTAALREDDLRDQGHVYWTQPPTPPMRDDVYLYTVDPLTPVKLTVQLEIELWLVNAYPGAELGDYTYDPTEITGVPHERQTFTQTFDITLLVPRSVVGPGNASR